MSADTISSPEQHPGSVPFEDMLMSLNGFEEIAVRKHMGVDPYDVIGEQVLIRRLLIFVDLQRKGLKPAEAVNGARELTARDVKAYFPPDPEEVDPEEPETAVGKAPSSSD